jgi:pyruvate/2-oxoglutarate dehydrogenase complex dihydrolipoamide acyltransferase (E2) component
MSVDTASSGWQLLGPVQRAMAKRMAEAASVPMAAIWKDVDVEGALKRVDELKRDGVPATLTAVIVEAVARGLREYPLIAAEFDFAEFKVRNASALNIGVAVAADRGLYVPVLQEAETESVEKVSVRLHELVRAVRAGGVGPEQLRGGRFTVTNIGGLGIHGGMPIPNIPQNAILGVASVRQEPVVRNGRVVPGQVTCLTLTIDHRAIDGITAARFLTTVAAAIEQA